jgi:hypothetical protein
MYTAKIANRTAVEFDPAKTPALFGMWNLIQSDLFPE